jgi:uncharacterized protein
MDKVASELVLITGGSGMIGSKLRHILEKQGYAVRLLARKQSIPKLKESGIDTYEWDVNSHDIQDGALKGVKHIVHLAGENIGDSRWTDARKKAILDSRIDAAATLEKALSKIRNFSLCLCYWLLWQCACWKVSNRRI